MSGRLSGEPMEIRALISGVVWEDPVHEALGCKRSDLWFDYWIQATLPFVPTNSMQLTFRQNARESVPFLDLISSNVQYDVTNQLLLIECRNEYRRDWFFLARDVGELAAWWERFGFTVDSRAYDEHMRIQRLEQKAAEEAKRRRRRRSGSGTGRRKGPRLTREQLPPPIWLDDEGEIQPIEELDDDEQDDVRGLSYH